MISKLAISTIVLASTLIPTFTQFQKVQALEPTVKLEISSQVQQAVRGKNGVVELKSCRPVNQEILGKGIVCNFIPKTPLAKALANNKSRAIEAIVNVKFVGKTVRRADLNINAVGSVKKNPNKKGFYIFTTGEF